MFLFLFLIIDLYFLIPTGITKNFIFAPEIAIPTGRQIKEAKGEMKTHSPFVEAKILKYSV